MIKTKNLKKDYTTGEVVTTVLKEIDLEINKGEFIAIIGKSGSGKSTLLYQIGLLDYPTSGTVNVDGVDVLKLSEKERTDFRLKNLGYIFQDYALVPELTAVENTMMPLLMENISFDGARKIAETALENVQLGHRINSLPNQLSGGEQQRVSIARAIAQKPKILFADEPTANLDSVSSELVLNLLIDLHKSGQTIVMVTHEPEYTHACDRVILIGDGVILDDNFVYKK